MSSEPVSYTTVQWGLDSKSKEFENIHVLWTEEQIKQDKFLQKCEKYTQNVKLLKYIQLIIQSPKLHQHIKYSPRKEFTQKLKNDLDIKRGTSVLIWNALCLY